ncbi:hypothetical protein [Pseudalkalibacillus salsuginis]|uniref:hypothetical protein n=1 Tax=Pseudalkalibacillus salsuginis TaxID=2910972 RepID=UPI001F26216E|nr:hypothetical protein [Pseudalkalibacillus salsuginis]MCF6410216.1 hypothetical protein [Pseudalkalibacillus salsuginis]
MSSSGKLFKSLSYMSIFFAPFIVPAIIFLLIDDLDVRQHARLASTSHLIPVIALATLSILFFESGQILNHFTIISMILLGGVAVTAAIWNLMKGIRVLQQK